MIRPIETNDEEWGYIQQLEASDEDVRDNAAGALHALDSYSSIPFMVSRLDTEPNEYIRGNLVFYISYILTTYNLAEHKKLVLETFERILETDQSEDVRNEIIDSLENIKKVKED